MGKFKETEIDIVTAALVALGRSLANQSDRNIVRFLGLVKRVTGDQAAKDGIDEVIEAIKDGPPNSTTLKRMLKDSQYDELRELVAQVFFYREMDIEDFCG